MDADLYEEVYAALEAIYAGVPDDVRKSAKSDDMSILVAIPVLFATVAKVREAITKARNAR